MKCCERGSARACSHPSHSDNIYKTNIILHMINCLRPIALLPMCQHLRYMICGQTPWISPAPARRAWQSEAKRCCARPLLSSGMLIGPDRRKQMACPPDTMVRPAPAHREQCQDKDWNNPCIIGFAFNMYMTPCMLFWNMHMNPHDWGHRRGED